jgi:glycosyltransferase involved in cell wall biosynthesis
LKRDLVLPAAPKRALLSGVKRSVAFVFLSAFFCPLASAASFRDCVQDSTQTGIQEASEDLLADQALKHLDTELSLRFENSRDRQEAWGKLALKKLTPAEEQTLLREFAQDGRDILIVADTNQRQTAGTVFVFKVLKKQIEQMTQNQVRVRVVDADAFPGHNLTSPDAQNGRIAFAGQKQVEEHLKNVQAVHIAMEGPVGLAFKTYCQRNNIPFTTAYHTMRPEYMQTLVEQRVLRAGQKSESFLSKYFSLIYRPKESNQPLLGALASRLGLTTRALVNAVVRRFHRESEAILVPTRSMRERLIGAGYSPDQLFAWSHGVELDLFKIPAGVDRVQLRQQLYPDADGPISLYVGRVSAEKNLIDFLANPIRGTKVVIGAGPELEAYKRQFPDVKFLGNKDHALELPNYLLAADVFWFPSVKDTFGLVMVEAMAMGTPVIGYDIQGPRDVIQSKTAGRIVDYQEPKSDLDHAANRKRLAQAFEDALTIDRAGVRRYALDWDWRFSTLEFLHRLSRLPTKP